MPHPQDFISSHPGRRSATARPRSFNCHVLDNCQACHEQHAAGDPRAHSLFNGLEYTPPPRATATVTPAPGSE